jgi:hypothetical protein
MDFSWKKPDPVTQDDKKDGALITADDIPEVDKLASSSDPQTPNQEEDEPKQAEPAIGIDFTGHTKDDSFDDDFTPKSPSPEPAKTAPEAPDEDEKEVDSSSAPDFGEAPTLVPEPTTPSKDDDKESSETAKPAEEKSSPALSSGGNKSLTDLENEIKEEKEKFAEELSKLQEKVSKLDNLLSKAQKMRDEEQTLIQEISTALG